MFSVPVFEVHNFPVKRGPVPNIPMEQLLTRFNTDAHFACYALPGSGTPRIRYKDIARMEQPPFLVMWALDIDLPGHSPWPDDPSETIRQYIDVFAGTRNPEILEGCGYYPTKHGLRVLLVPDQPIPVELAGSWIRQLLNELSWIPGLDQSCKDWTRLFRLPRVVRDGAPTWPREEDMPFPIFLPEKRMSWRPDVLIPGFFHSGATIDIDCPAPQDLAKPTKATLNKVPKALRYTVQYGKPLSDVPGARHKAILDACVLLVSNGFNHPIEVLEILYPSIKVMPQDRDFYSEAWNIAKWVCEAHEGKREKVREELEELQKEHIKTVDEVRGKVDLGDLPPDKALIIEVGRNVYVFDGSPYIGPFQPNFVHAAIRDNLPELDIHTHRGDLADLPELLYRYGVSLRHSKFTYNPRSRVVGDTFETSVVKFPRDAKPEFNKDIDDYINLWPVEVKEWLSVFLHTDKPLAALYINGRKGIGKGLLRSLLASCFSGIYTRYQDLLTSSFNESLLNSPLVVLDEGTGGLRADVDQFRELIGTTTWPISVKFKSNAQLEGSPRFLITANNIDALKMPPHPLTSDDIEALASRVVYVRVDEGDPFTDFLYKLNREYRIHCAADPDDERGPDIFKDVWLNGAFYNYLLWLSENYKFKAAKRFMVETRDWAWRDYIAQSHGSTESILAAIAVALTRKMEFGLYILAEGRIWIRLNELRSRWKDLEQTRCPGTKTLTDVFRSLGCPVERFRLPEPWDTQPSFWGLPADPILDRYEAMGLGDPSLLRQKIKRPLAKALDTSPEVS